MREAVGLHVARADAEQPRRFERMRREHRRAFGAAVGAARAQPVAQRALGGDRVERVGVEHEPRRVVHHGIEHVAHGLAAAAAAHHGGAGQRARIERAVERAMHQLGPRRVDRRVGTRVERAQVHAPAAGRERRVRREPRRAGHARGAADDRHVAEAALVLGVSSRWVRRVARAAQPRAGRRGLRIDLQRRVPHRARRIAALRGEQPRLDGEEGDRVMRLHARARRVPRVGREAGGHVDGQAQRRQPVEQRYRSGDRAFGRAVRADAEQRVDGQLDALVRREVGADGHAGGARPRERVGRVGTQAGLVGQQLHAHVAAEPMQVRGRHQPVAAVVAGPGGDPHAARVRRERHREPGGGLAGATHQRMRLAAGQRRGLDAARRGHVVQRDAIAHAGHAMHGVCRVGHGRSLWSTAGSPFHRSEEPRR